MLPLPRCSDGRPPDRFEALKAGEDLEGRAEGSSNRLAQQYSNAQCTNRTKSPCRSHLEGAGGRQPWKHRDFEASRNPRQPQPNLVRSSRPGVLRPTRSWSATGTRTQPECGTPPRGPMDRLRSPRGRRARDARARSRSHMSATTRSTGASIPVGPGNWRGARSSSPSSIADRRMPRRAWTLRSGAARMASSRAERRRGGGGSRFRNYPPGRDTRQARRAGGWYCRAIFASMAR